MLNEMAKRALLVSLVEKMKNGGSWCGETHVQKCVYFLQQLLKVPMNFNYILYKHGPYSFDLNDELSFLRGSEFLELHPRRPYGPSLSPGKLGAVLKSKYDHINSRYSWELDFVVAHLANMSVRELEKVATALYVKKEKKWTTSEDILGQMVELKPHITREKAEEALKTLQEMEENAATRI